MTAGSREGFTLVEIMIVVSIVALLAAIAIPSFARARETSQRNACISILRTISAAQDQWAIENGKSSSDNVVEHEVILYIKGIPRCPAGGTYHCTTVEENPTCTILSHAL